MTEEQNQSAVVTPPAPDPFDAFLGEAGKSGSSSEQTPTDTAEQTQVAEGRSGAEGQPPTPTTTEEATKGEEAQAPVQVDNLEVLKRLASLYTTPAPAPASAPTESAPVAPTPSSGEVDFVGKLGANLDYSDPAVLNKVFNAVYQHALQQQEVLRSQLRQEFEQSSVTIVNYQLAAIEFYKQNPDLALIKPIVGNVAKSLADKNPTWGVGQLYDETAKFVRSNFGLQAPGVKASTSTQAPTASAPQVAGARPPAQQERPAVSTPGVIQGDWSSFLRD